MDALLGSLPVVGDLFDLSFKANRVRDVPEGCLPPSLGWLIFSDNEIEKLPACIG